MFKSGASSVIARCNACSVNISIMPVSSAIGINKAGETGLPWFSQRMSNSTPLIVLSSVLTIGW